MQGEDSSEDRDRPSFTESERLRFEEILRATGEGIRRENAYEKRKKQILSDALHTDSFFEGYVIRDITRGCENRRYTRKGDGQPHTFLVRDCIHEETGESRVVKYPNPCVLAARPDLAEQIYHEQKILSLFNHPNIVRQYGVIQSGEVPYLVLEYLPFQVQEVVGMCPDMEGVLFFAFESAKALMELQRKGVVHGDIKEQQFMGCRKPGEPHHRRIKLIDFTGSSHPDIIPNRSSYTPLYAAPELIRTRSKGSKVKRIALTHKADIHALGITYARLALQEHMNSEEITGLFKEQDNRTERVIEALYDFDKGSTRPPAFNKIISEMVSPDPDQRPDATELMRMLLGYCKIPGTKPQVQVVQDLWTKEVCRISIDSQYGGVDNLYESPSHAARKQGAQPEGEQPADIDEVTDDELELARASLLALKAGGNR